MGGCSFLRFSLVSYRMSRLRAFYKSKGLKSQLVTLDNGSTIHCWVQTEGEEERKRKRSWRGGRGEQQQQGRPHRPPARDRMKTRQDYGGSRGLWRRSGGFWRGQSQRGPPPPPRQAGGGGGGGGGRPVHQRPALVFIHGFGGDGITAWERQISAFSKEYRVLVPDLLFFGKSSTRNTQRTEIFQADCVANMLMKLGVQEAHVVGASYGGFVAFWMAYKYPQLCWKVVLASAGICMNPRTNDELLRRCNLRSIDEVLLPTTVDGLKLAFSCVYARPPPLPDFIVQQMLDMFYKREDRQQRLELLQALVIGSEKCPPLPILRQEVLLLWGREDRVFKLSLAKQLQEHLGAKQAELVVIEGAGHVPQLEKSKEFNCVILNFLDDSETSSSRSR